MFLPRGEHKAWKACRRGWWPELAETPRGHVAIEMPRPRQRGVAPWAPGSLDAERSPRPGLQGAAVLMSHLPRPFADLNQENDPRVTREAAFGVGEEQGVVLGGGPLPGDLAPSCPPGKQLGETGGAAGCDSKRKIKEISSQSSGRRFLLGGGEGAAQRPPPPVAVPSSTQSVPASSAHRVPDAREVTRAACSPPATS